MSTELPQGDEGLQFLKSDGPIDKDLINGRIVDFLIDKLFENLGKRVDILKGQDFTLEFAIAVGRSGHFDFRIKPSEEIVFELEINGADLEKFMETFERHGSRIGLKNE